MNTRHTFRWFWLAVSTVFLAIAFTSQPGATQSQGNASVRTAGGLTIVTFDVDPGKIIVHLPDDMRAGDTISGTVVTEPKGDSAEEKAKNQNALNTTVLDLGGTKIPADRPMFRWTPAIPQPDMPVRYQIRLVEILGRPIPDGTTQPGAVIPLDPTTIQPGAVTTPNKTTTPNFNIPTLGQTGRRIVITGPFDGNASNTTLDWSKERNTESGSSSFGLMAESPRKAVFVAPADFTGSADLTLKEGSGETKGTYRNLGVNLSAPKTNLLKGERTTLTVEVSGLEGITEPAPLQLDATGVILMDGGNFQNLRINPSEVNQQGRYTTTRAITGQQAGAFTVLATVIVDRFDVCIADDSKPHSGILWNTFTGDYIFTNLAPPPRPGGQPPIGGTVTPGGTPTAPPGGTVTPGGTPLAPPGGTSLTGTGKPIRKGCIITLTHNAPDRRVFARLDACTKSGDATVQTTSPTTKVTITDKNVSDNTCASK